MSKLVTCFCNILLSAQGYFQCEIKPLKKRQPIFDHSGADYIYNGGRRKRCGKKNTQQNGRFVFASKSQELMRTEKLVKTEVGVDICG